jgi:hypothetical protein
MKNLRDNYKIFVKFLCAGYLAQVRKREQPAWLLRISVPNEGNRYPNIAANSFLLCICSNIQILTSP